MSAAVVSAQSLSKWYGQVIGLNDVTVEIPAGIVGLLGPNGAGKSTFMKLVTGQLKPSQGTVLVFGAPIWGHPVAYADIGYCPDQDAFYERMTGLEWVTALTRLTGLDESAAKKAAAQALDTVALSEVAGKKIGAYSKGMRQRIQAGPGAGARPEPAAARRAAGRDGSARSPPHDQAHQDVVRGGEDGGRLESHPA